MPLSRPPLRTRVLVIAALAVLSIAALVLFVRYGSHRLAMRLRRRAAG